jgi:hypothetical protein
MSKLTFRVKFKANVKGKIIEGIEEEGSWYLVDQTGNMFSYGPMKPILPISKQYIECTPLIKINDEYLTVEEIERRLSSGE